MFAQVPFVFTSSSIQFSRAAPMRLTVVGNVLGLVWAIVATLISCNAYARDSVRTSRSGVSEIGNVQRVNNGRILSSPSSARSSPDYDENLYAPAPLQPIPFAPVDPRVENGSSARIDGRMSVEERRRLRREIDEAGRDIYRSRR
ncbi:MAG TPA: hypothetical protein VFS42_08825 [Burkholderiaceae bacterium]|nr:hypothetical protein [Burkholderiaceae bacterium]